jgi:hypothetical protein
MGQSRAAGIHFSLLMALLSIRIERIGRIVIHYHVLMIEMMLYYCLMNSWTSFCWSFCVTREGGEDGVFGRLVDFKGRKKGTLVESHIFGFIKVTEF